MLASIGKREGVEPSLFPAIHPRPQGYGTFWRIPSKPLIANYLYLSGSIRKCHEPLAIRYLKPRLSQTFIIKVASLRSLLDQQILTVLPRTRLGLNRQVALVQLWLYSA